MCVIVHLEHQCGHRGRFRSYLCERRRFPDPPCANSRSVNTPSRSRCWHCQLLTFALHYDRLEWQRRCRGRGQQPEYTSLDYARFRVHRRRTYWSLWINVCLMLNCAFGAWLMRQFYMWRFRRELRNRRSVWIAESELSLCLEISVLLCPLFPRFLISAWPSTSHHLMPDMHGQSKANL